MSTSVKDRRMLRSKEDDADRVVTKNLGKVLHTFDTDFVVGQIQATERLQRRIHCLRQRERARQ